jgi:uncharacterized protein (UPF0333 family)
VKSQTSIEYLIMVGVGVIIALVAAAAVFLVSGTTADELNSLKSVKKNIVEGLK